MMTLACGPYFSAAGLLISAVALLVIKPVTYFAFIQAFRYRVSRAIPMSFRRAAGLAVLRSVLGAAGFALIATILSIVESGSSNYFGVDITIIAWILLVLERLAIWCLIGWYFAGLRGRRLLGWTFSGTLIDVAYDITVMANVGDMIWSNIILVLGLLAFLIPLHIIGRRDELRYGFTNEPRCSKCQYNLTGNLSGECPECGERVPYGVV